MNKALVFFAGLLFLFAGGMTILFAMRRGGDAGPDNNHIVIAAQEDEVIEDGGEPIEFSFLDQNGKRFDSKTLDGKLWVGSIFFSSCPSTCRAQNMRVAELQRKYKGQDVEFLSITCDPEVDTSPTLNRYAQTFSADADKWHFLTGDLDLIKRVGGKRLGISVNDKVHSDRLVLFARDGARVKSYRSLEPDQFVELMDEIDRRLAEDAPEEEVVAEVSKALPAAAAPIDDPQSDALPEAAAADPTGADAKEVNEHADGGEDAESRVEFSFLDQNGKRFESKMLDGKLWVGSIFFSSCPSTCRAQNMRVAELQTRYKGKDVEFVSITCDPEIDTSPTLNNYAQKFAADAETWHFLTGDLELIKKVGGKRLGITVDDKVHSDRLVLFDREGARVNSYRSLEPDQFVALTEELDRRLSGESDEEGNAAQAAGAAEIAEPAGATE